MTIQMVGLVIGVRKQKGFRIVYPVKIVYPVS